ncbi:MAG: hypothetical protein AAFR87_16535, partial [Bacteroidota bacterium]
IFRSEIRITGFNLPEEIFVYLIKMKEELFPALIQMLQQDSMLDKGWEQFLLHFNEVNKDFFREIKSSYPDLTPKDLKLCAYMRMNLSTKEMASLLNVTVRGIEASRYRLRKKFDLDSSQNLTEFLMAY